jgi:hypothetical protein
VNVASLELAFELHALSGWETGTKFGHPSSGLIAPNYDLGYLLRKLPQRTDIDEDKWSQAFDASTPETFFLAWEMDTMRNRFRVQMQIEDEVIHQTLFEAATPEDALAQMFIELFKQGILEKEKHDGIANPTYVEADIHGHGDDMWPETKKAIE